MNARQFLEWISLLAPFYDDEHPTSLRAERRGSMVDIKTQDGQTRFSIVRGDAEDARSYAERVNRLMEREGRKG